MSDKQMVWIDVERCTACGSCVEACPTGAIVLANGKAQVDESLCRGCEVCIDACPEGAIQPVLQGELVPIQERPAPAVRQPAPLAETAGVAVAAAGLGLLARAAGALARRVGRWLASRPEPKGISARQSGLSAGASAPLSNGRRSGGGRRLRRRRRGR